MLTLIGFQRPRIKNQNFEEIKFLVWGRIPTIYFIMLHFFNWIKIQNNKVKVLNFNIIIISCTKIFTKYINLFKD